MQKQEDSNEQREYHKSHRPENKPPQNKYSNKQKKYREDNSDSDQNEEVEREMTTCRDCRKKVKKTQMSVHLWHCKPLHHCQYCKGELPEYLVISHEVMCHKNPVTRARMKEFNDSSLSSSSDEEEEEYEDQDGYWTRQRPQKYSDSDNEEPQTIARRTEQPLFNIQPRRQYTLSQSSSEEDQRTRYLRNQQEAFRVMPTSFYVRTLQTDIEGITITISSQGQGGRILRRTLYNRQTGQHRTISQHRFLRHYQNHILPNQNFSIDNGVLIISHHSQNVQELNSMFVNVSINGLSEQQLSQLTMTTYQPQKQKDNCAICFIDYQEGQKLIVLKCKHRFHDGCVTQWLKQNPLCPLCKATQKQQ